MGLKGGALIRVGLLAGMIATGLYGQEARASAEIEPSEQGRPYILENTQVWDVPDPASGRSYQVFISLPASYDASSDRHYPALYITDANYGFPLIRSIAPRLNVEGPKVEDFILVGLSYAQGENPAASRRRDYTPTPNGPSSAPGDAVHGQAAAYQDYIRDHVLPFVEERFHADPARRIFMGHSYGALFGAQVLLTDPALFSAYILGSPSFWYDDRHILTLEADYAGANSELPASVFLYVGGFETIRPGEERYNRTFDLVADMADFETRLRSRDYQGLDLAAEVLAGEDHLTVFPSGFTRGLLRALPARRD